MNDFFRRDEYEFDADDDKEWFIVHSGAVTNTNPGSMVHVYINTTPICPNMTNREFRIMVARLIKWSIILVDQRIADLKQYDERTRERMIYWFNRCNENTRQYLINGFSRQLSVLKTLTPHNFVRSDPNLDRMLGCVPNMGDIDNEAAHVCGPNTERRLISIAAKFCTGLRDQNMYGDSRLSTLIHEVTHFVDTFGSCDTRYGLDPTSAAWARANPELALRNADTLTGFVIYGEDLFSE
ncbi:M35 family metallo-endopeptidase [Burkholderia sp. AU15512]|uniref:M35 family metallo-endopeptidase n=1 Tax=Burkholderia sp. AU15512 TaxID=2015345 RepID=UPI000B7A2FD2|nr:M35 family metallo-endopeptidase [Burkholderia sp. AU15512]OXI18586.1 peptidase M35 [Burkholderia sp. AU15512]